MSRSPAKSRQATAMKSLKEKWLSIVQLVREKGEKGIGGSSTVTTMRGVTTRTRLQGCDNNMKTRRLRRSQ